MRCLLRFPVEVLLLCIWDQTWKIRASHLYQGMDFVGLFNQKAFEFTDVAYSLRTLLNIPEGKKFRFQRGCMHCLEHKVQEYAQKKLGEGKQGEFQLPQLKEQQLHGNTGN